MDFTLHTTFPEDLAGAWNELLTESVNHVPFLRYEYLANWWQTRGGGEWPKDSQLVLATAQHNGELAGIAPLFFAEYQETPSLLLLGSIEISDYLSALVRQDDLDAFTQGLLDFLQTDERIPDWKALDLHNVIEGSDVIAVLEKEADQRGWQFFSERTYPSPYIDLPGDWDTYLANLDKKQRHEIRRKIRRLEESEISSRWYIVEDPDTLESEIQDFLDLMAQDKDKADFLTDEMKETMRMTIRTAFQQGYLQLVFLEIGGEKAAAYLDFDYNNKIYVYNSGMNKKFWDYSAGWVVLGYLLRWANENKREEFDFLRGDEDYKYRFGAVDRYVRRVKLTR